MKSIVAVALAGMIAAIEADAQASLAPSATLPTVDGSLTAGEYAYSTTVRDMRIGATLGTDGMLYLAIQAPTAGWVAIGTGGLVMNGSRLYFGSVQGGKQVFQEMSGAGHGAIPAKAQVVRRWAVGAEGGSTTLELVLSSSDAIWKGSINAIMAFSSSPDFRTKHRERGSLSFAVK